MPLEVVKELIRTTNKKGVPILKQPTAEERKKMNEMNKLKAERDAKKAENAKPEVSVPPTVNPPTVNQPKAPIKQTTTQIKQTPKVTPAKTPVVAAQPPAPPVAPLAKSPNDLTTFIKDSELLIISDFEGTTPKTQFEKFAEYARGGGAAEGVKNKKVIYLGDVFDSTATLNKPFKLNELETIDASYCVQDDNYCALQSVKLLVDNPTQCKYVVGNRDLNKIKLLPFFQFKTGEKWWNPAGATSYESIVEKLLDTVGDGDKEVWLVGGKVDGKDTTMDFFKPFWNIGKWNTKDSITARATKNYTKIYDRFEALFGADGVEGTMSAINTLKSIPNEMFASRSDNMTIETFIEKLNNKPADKNVVRAALVITLFMRMLDKDLWKEGDATQKEKKVGDFGALDGYLYKYITEAKPAYYAVSDQEKNLLLFAHGGITKDFVTGKGTKATELLATVKWDEVLLLNDSEQKGGAGNPITDSIDNFNGKYNELLTAFFAKKYEGTPAPAKLEDYTGMLTLLQLSAGFANPKIKEKFTVEGEFKDDKLSPIQRKDASYENLDEFISPYNKIYNIFGHYSVSAGYSFGKSTGSAKTYFINTDYSSSLFKDGIDCTDAYNENYLQLKLDTKTNRLFLDGTVILNEKYTPLQTEEITSDATDETVFKTIKGVFTNIKNNLIEDNQKTESIQDKYYIHGGAVPTQPLRIEFSNDVNLLGDDIMKYSENLPVAVEGDTVSIFGNQTAVTPGNKQIIFNGVAKLRDDKNYKVYSTTSYLLPYPKTGFIFIPTGIIEGDAVEIIPTTPNEKPEIARVVAIDGEGAVPTVTVVNAADVSQTISINRIEPVDPAVLESAKTAVLQAELPALLPSTDPTSRQKTPLQEFAAAVIANPIYSVPNENTNPPVAMTEATVEEQPIYATVNSDEDNPTVSRAEAAKPRNPIYEDLTLLNAAAAEEEKRNREAAEAAATAPPITEKDIEELIPWKTWYINSYEPRVNPNDYLGKRFFTNPENITKSNKNDADEFYRNFHRRILDLRDIVNANGDVNYKNQIIQKLNQYEPEFIKAWKKQMNYTSGKTEISTLRKISIEFFEGIIGTVKKINEEVDSKIAAFKRQILNNDLLLLKIDKFISFFTQINNNVEEDFNLFNDVEKIQDDDIKKFIFKKKKDFELELQVPVNNYYIYIKEMLKNYIKGIDKKFEIGQRVVYKYKAEAQLGGEHTVTHTSTGTITSIDIIIYGLKPILQYTIDCGTGGIKTAFYNADISLAQQGGFIRKRNKKTKKSYYSHKHKKTIRKDKKSKHKKQTLRDKKQWKNKKTKRRRT